VPVKHPGPLFLTFEGIDGCGKTTHAILACRYLIDRGYEVKMLREPGSTKVAERIRKILLDNRLSIDPITELLLYEAARASVTAAEIVPFRTPGHVVICDRFFDSTTAYQGYGRKLDIRMVRSLHKVAAGGLSPDLTLLFDLDPREAHARLHHPPDRLESEPVTFFERVRRGFLEIARKERHRVKVIDASRPIEAVFAEVTGILARRYGIE
jgi:dTMP kinase